MEHLFKPPLDVLRIVDYVVQYTSFAMSIQRAATNDKYLHYRAISAEQYPLKVSSRMPLSANNKKPPERVVSDCRQSLRECKP